MNTYQGGSALVAEEIALRNGLTMVWERGHWKLECEMDSLELVTEIGDDELARFVP